MGGTVHAKERSCTAVDLYAARCAVVHTYTPESDLSRTGKARLVAYAFGPAQLEKLEEASALAHQNRQVNVHARQLIDAFYKGIKAYLDEVETDTSRLQEIERSASQWTVNMDPKTMDKYLEGKKLLKTQTEDPSPH
jgi:hypothetical protein